MKLEMNDEILQAMITVLGVVPNELTDRQRALNRVVEYANSLDWGHDIIHGEQKPKKKDKKVDEYLERLGYDES